MCGAATVQLLLVYFLQQHWVFKFLAVTPSKALFPLLLQNNSFQCPYFNTYSFPYLTLGNHVDGGHCCGLVKAFCNLSISSSAWNIFKLLVIKGRQVRVKSQFVSVHHNFLPHSGCEWTILYYGIKWWFSSAFYLLQLLNSSVLMSKLYC